MKTQGRPQSTNVVDARNFNVVEHFLLEGDSELKAIGRDLYNALSSPFGGPEYLVLPTNFNSTYEPPQALRQQSTVTKPRKPQ